MLDPEAERRDPGWEHFDAKAFYEELGQSYPEARVVYSTLEGRLRRTFVRKFLRRQTGTLLDVGCNVGIHLQEYRGPRIGVDLAPSVLKVAEKRVPDAVFHVGSAEEMSFLPDESVDVVLCTEVLEHVEKPRTAIAEFGRVLRAGGRALISTPNRLHPGESDWIEPEILEYYGIQKRPYFHTSFTPEQLASMAADAHLVVEEHGSFGHEEIYCGAATYPLYELGARINQHTFQSRKLDNLMRNGYFLLERAVYRTVVMLGLRRHLNRRVPQGKFSYVIARKDGGAMPEGRGPRGRNA